MDSDFQSDPKNLIKLIDTIKENNNDFVIGKRTMRNDRFFRVLVSRVANFFIKKIFKSKISDLGCSLKIVKTKILKEITLYGDAHRYISLILSKQGYKFSEIGVIHNKRLAGVSKYGYERTIKVLSDIFYLYFTFNFFSKPMQLFGWFGFFCLVSSFAFFIIMLFFKYYFEVSFILTPIPLIVVMLIILGFLSFLLGVISEILIRIYFELHKKKNYEIFKKINF